MALVVVAVAAAVVPAKGTKNERGTKKKKAAVKWALRLCIAVDHSRRWTAEIREDSRRRLSSRRRKRNGVCKRGYDIP